MNWACLPGVSRGAAGEGWLELRKGYHTSLSENGRLVILRDDVLRRTLQTINPATTRNQLKQRRARDSSGEKKLRRKGRGHGGQQGQGQGTEGGSGKESKAEEDKEEEEGLDLTLLLAHDNAEAISSLSEIDIIDMPSETPAKLGSLLADGATDMGTAEDGDGFRVLLQMDLRKEDRGRGPQPLIHSGLSWDPSAGQRFSARHYGSKPHDPSVPPLEGREHQQQQPLIIGPWQIEVSVEGPPSGDLDGEGIGAGAGRVGGSETGIGGIGMGIGIGSEAEAEVAVRAGHGKGKGQGQGAPSRPLVEIDAVLQGFFQYSQVITVYAEEDLSVCKELYFAWTLLESDGSGVGEDDLEAIRRRFKGTDQRLKEGLPLLVTLDGSDGERNYCSPIELNITFRYRYI